MTSTALWDAVEFEILSVDPRSLAISIGTELGEPSAAMHEVLRLHLEALDGALSLGVPELLADQLRWQEIRLSSQDSHLTADVVEQAVLDALDPLLDEVGRARVRDLHNTARALGEVARVADAAVELPPGPARTYLMSTLACDRDGAIALIRESLDGTQDPADIMLGILQPAQIELGRLWEVGAISIAHEHYTTAITQLSMSLLYPRMIANRVQLGFTMVAAGVGSEAHEVGLRMISDLFDQAGWRTAYLGADIPDSVVIDQVAQQRADVLALSATMSGHIPHLRRLIAAVRADERCRSVRILVGGRPFLINPELGRLVGADGWAADVRDALALCSAWMRTGSGAG